MDSKKVNDQFKIIFSIVKEISEGNIPHATDYGIPDDRFVDLLEIAQDAHLIKNVKVLRNGNGSVYSLIIERAKVTFEGLQFLHENSNLMKTYKGLKEVREWIPFF